MYGGGISPKPTVMYTIPSLPNAMRDALPDAIAEKMSFTSTSALPSQRPRASVIVAGALAPPRPPAFAAAWGVFPAALPPRPPAAAAFSPRPSVGVPQRPVGARMFAPVLAAGLWYVK